MCMLFLSRICLKKIGSMVLGYFAIVYVVLFFNLTSLSTDPFYIYEFHIGIKLSSVIEYHQLLNFQPIAETRYWRKMTFLWLSLDFTFVLKMPPPRSAASSQRGSQPSQTTAGRALALPSSISTEELREYFESRYACLRQDLEQIFLLVRRVIWFVKYAVQESNHVLFAG